jgi:hypothetical protein
VQIQVTTCIYHDPDTSDPEHLAWVRSSPGSDFYKSVLDPDPHWFRSAGSGSRRAKMTHTIKREKKNYISCFEMLDVLFEG